jgi:peroxiredoxin
MQLSTFLNRKAGLVVVCFVSAMTLAGAQGQAPAGQTPPVAGAAGQGRPGGQGRGIAAPDYPVLPIGSPLPDFTLEGIDGKMHKSSDYTKTKALAILFESVHCPVSIAYEGRAEELYRTYRDKGLTFIAINPNNPKAVRLNELGYTDMTDSMPEMKVRAAFKGIDWPYLYDGETQVTSMKFGAVATPHIFIFDQDHTLRYQGAIDDNQKPGDVKNHYAKDAIEALLAGKPVATAESRAFGCSTKWLSKKTGVEEEWASILAEPVTVDPINADGLKALRANAGTGKTMVVSFWSTSCTLCASQFEEVQKSWWMYRRRPYLYTTVSVDAPAKRDAVVRFLEKQHAGNPNKQFASTDVPALQAAFGAKWNPSQPFIMVIGPDGKLVYQKEGRWDIHEVRRHIVSTFPDSAGYPGNQAYFQESVQRMLNAPKK